MDDRNNFLLMFSFAGGIAALGLSIVGNKYFHAEEPEKPGYAIQGVEEEGEGEGGGGPALATLMQTADVAKGKAAFGKCAACHSDAPSGANGIGPALYGVMGKPLGAHPGFAYSDALTSVGGVWSFEQMDAWLKSPRKFAAGTKMTFAGLSDPVERANLIAYLNSMGSNLPMPAAPAADAAAAEAGEAVEAGEATATATASAGAVGAPGPEAPKEGATVKQAATDNTQ